MEEAAQRTEEWEARVEAIIILRADCDTPKKPLKSVNSGADRKELFISVTSVAVRRKLATSDGAEIFI